MFSFFSGSVDFNSEADKLRATLNQCETDFKSIRNVNSSKVTFKNLEAKYNSARKNLEGVVNRISTLKKKFTNIIEAKSAEPQNRVPIFSQDFITKTPNGKKYMITKMPSIRVMNKIIKNFKLRENERQKIKINSLTEQKRLDNIKKKEMNDEAKRLALVKKANANIVVAQKVAQNEMFRKKAANIVVAQKVAQNEMFSKRANEQAKIESLKARAGQMSETIDKAKRNINVMNTVNSVLKSNVSSANIR